MESITIKVEKSMAREIDKAMNPMYATKTEFIRDAIRERIENMKKDSILEDLWNYFGKAKTKTTYDEERQIREKAGREFAKKFGVDLD